ncbi:MAG: hypothetical protein JXJ04_03995 [Spirochaetales bacterium]|nr:hypothetical protein [Spirochaetales bacterium]
MKAMRIILICMISITYILASITLTAAEEGYLYQLQLSLKSYGWPDEEISSVMNAAKNLNWEGIENDSCDVVAYSLQYCKRSGQETSPGEKAQIAYHLAITTSEMKALGFDEKLVVRVAIDSTREIVQSLQKYGKNDDAKGIGDMIRERIRDQVCKEGCTAQQDKLMERVQRRIKTGKKESGNPHNGTGNGPPH